MTTQKFTRTTLMIIYLFVTVITMSVMNHSFAYETKVKNWQMYTMEGKPSLRGSAIKGESLWVTGSNNSVFVSQNSGVAWQNKSVNAPIKTDFRDIALFNKKTAIVMGVGTGESSVLYKTHDGGDSWQLLYQNTDEEGFFDSIGFWNNDVGLLLGDPVDGFYVIKKTEDGGKTWRRIKQEKLPVMLNKEAAFAASGNTLIVGQQGKAYITTGGFSASVYSSNDYGESWQRHTVPLFNETQTAGGYGLALNESQQLFVLGGDYKERHGNYDNVATMVDGRWEKVAANNNGLRTAMSCLASTCIITGKTSSDISFDGGVTWQLLLNKKAKTGNQGFYTLSADNDLFLSAGAEGSVGLYKVAK